MKECGWGPLKSKFIMFDFSYIIMSEYMQEMLVVHSKHYDIVTKD